MLEFSSHSVGIPLPSPSPSPSCHHHRLFSLSLYLPIMSSVQTRHRAIGLYKELIRLGRDYPNPGYNFIPKVQAAFRASAGLTDQKAIEEKLALADHVKNETLALISLSKYRYLRRTYSVPNEDFLPDVPLENTKG